MSISRSRPATASGTNPVMKGGVRPGSPVVKLLVSLISAICLALASFSMAQETAATCEQHSGSTLNVLVQQNPWSSNVSQEDIARFEDDTGVNVNYDVLVTEQYRQKLNVEFLAQSNAIDVFSSLPPMELRSHYYSGWYEPLDEYLDNPTFAASDFDFDDFFDSTIEASTINGELIGLPYFFTGEILMYNEEIFSEHDVEVPETLEELRIAAAELTRPDQNLYGFTSRGMGSGVAVPPFVPFLFNMGGSWVDAEGNAAINSEAALQAFELYGELMREYNPPGPLNFNWRQAQDAFIGGNAAMWVGMGLFAANAEDPDQSRVAGDIGYAMVPEGPGGQNPQVDLQAISISRYSDNKDAAWCFLQWVTGKEMAQEVQLAGVPSTRASAWEADEFVTGWKEEHPELVEITLDMLEIAGPNEFPPVVDVQRAREAVSTVITAAIQGRDVERAANEANKTLQRLVDQTRELEAQFEETN